MFHVKHLFSTTVLRPALTLFGSHQVSDVSRETFVTVSCKLSRATRARVFSTVGEMQKIENFATVKNFTSRAARSRALLMARRLRQAHGRIQIERAVQSNALADLAQPRQHFLPGQPDTG